MLQFNYLPSVCVGFILSILASSPCLAGPRFIATIKKTASFLDKTTVETLVDQLTKSPADVLKKTRSDSQHPLYGLNECDDHQCELNTELYPARRTGMIHRIIEDFKKHHPKKSEPIRLVFSGSGGLFSETRILTSLATAGYTHLSINLVDSLYQGFIAGLRNQFGATTEVERGKPWDLKAHKLDMNPEGVFNMMLWLSEFKETEFTFSIYSSLKDLATVCAIDRSLRSTEMFSIDYLVENYLQDAGLKIRTLQDSYRSYDMKSNLLTLGNMVADSDRKKELRKKAEQLMEHQSEFLNPATKKALLKNKFKMTEEELSRLLWSFDALANHRYFTFTESGEEAVWETDEKTGALLPIAQD